MHYCFQCGHALEFRVPEGDNLPRYLCPSCSHIHYQNPKIVSGCIVHWDDALLLCRRNIEPRKGYWTLPAGFLENGESTSDGAVRETVEEACIDVDGLELFSLINVVPIHQVHMFYRARPHGDDYGAGAETQAAEVFREQDIPWRRISFPTVFHTIRLFYRELREARFGFHTFDLGEGAWDEMRAQMDALDG
jgi:ADP-ribose pyrophosphatase YjhB (NUDIX family)